MSDLHDLSAPYALDSLEPLERVRFEAHLETCSRCQHEVRGFAATAARLGGSQAETPPAGLREAIMNAAADTPQERPVRRTPGRFRRALPQVAVAAALALGVAGAGGYLWERDRANDQVAQTDRVNDVMTASDAQIETKEFENGGVVRMVMSAERNAAVIMAKDLPSPGADKVYQMWMVSGDDKVSQGTLTDSGTMVMEDLATADSVAVTIEPDGGSDQPTTEPIAAIEL